MPAKVQDGSAKVALQSTKASATVDGIDLLKARQDGLISVQAKGRGDGRMTIAVTNRTRRPLRIVLSPGIIAQSATGQFGGMGGMGGGMGGVEWAGGMGGGMGAAWAAAWAARAAWAAWAAWAWSGTMPSTMGMMMFSRIIMYFCGDPDSWDMRSIMIGMMGGMMGGMGGGMGGMGGGMGGGMMGGMGGGGMRSVPPTELPSALLQAGPDSAACPRGWSASRHLIPSSGLSLPGKGEPLGSSATSPRSTTIAQVQKPFLGFQRPKAPTSLSQLVMWSLAADLDWSTIAELSQRWANPYELALARSFVDHLDSLPPGESGRLLVQVDALDSESEPAAAALSSAPGIDGAGAVDSSRNRSRPA